MLILIIITALLSCTRSIEASSGDDSSYLGLSTFYINAIDALYKVDNLPSLAIQIHDIYQLDDVSSFVQMVKLQLYLYHKHNKLGDYNNAYVFNVGYYLYIIREDPLNTQLASNVQQQLQESIEQLPSSLRYLFFESSFCLRNRQYLEYIYTTTAIKIDAQRRHIFIWKDPTWVGTNGRWIREITDDSNKNELKLEFALKNDLTQMFLYRESQVGDYTNLITAWQPGNKPNQADWTVELYQNQLIFKQDGQVMCASDFSYSNARRFVNGYVIDNNGYNEMTSACQWYAKDCPV